MERMREWREEGETKERGKNKMVLRGRAGALLKGLQPIDDTGKGTGKKKSEKGAAERNLYVLTSPPVPLIASLEGLSVTHDDSKVGKRGIWNEVSLGKGEDR